MSQQSKVRQKSIVDRRKSSAAVYLNSRVGDEINTLFRSKTPLKTAQEIKRMLVKDKTGDAMKGFRAQLMDETLGRAQLNSLDLEGKPFINGTQVKNLINEHKEIYAEFFDVNSMKRLLTIADEADRINAAKRLGKEIDAIIDDEPVLVVELLSRVAGADLGSRISMMSKAHPLIAAQAGSQMVRKLTNKIPIARTRDVLVEATQNEELMKTLLTRIDSPQAQARVDRRLHVYLFNILPSEQDMQEFNQ